MPRPPCTLILNRRAGSAAAPGLEQRLRRRAEELGLELDWRVVDGPQIEATARAALDAGHDLVVGGGDGTASSVAGLLAGSERCLGLLPLGTRNHLAKDLGLPLDPEAALAVVARDQRRRIDLGQVNERRFTNNASLGIYPRALLESHRWRHRLAAVAVGVIRNLVHKRRYRFDFQARGTRFTLRTASVFVGNNAYAWELARLARRPRLDAGRVVCYLPARRRHLGLAELLAGLASSGQRRQPWSSLALRAFRLDSRAEQLPVSLDGELHLLRPPLDFRSLPGALWVFTDGERSPGT